MATKLEKLMFAIGIRDEGSSKLTRLQQSIDRTCRQVRNNFEGIKAGALSAGASGMSLYQMINPAVDFNRAVGEVDSLGVAGDALQALQGQAKQFAMQYGGNAAEVIRASYDIQSAIAGLQGKELGTFTVASATLAKGIKADTATVTDYMGTMYGVWQAQADKMGRGQWVERLAGQTALAVQMFKTNGTKWAEGMSALGASATAKGIGVDEQFSVMGNLETTMGGSEAATKYKAFLTGALSAQKKLGLNFFGKDGKMLGTMDILDKITSKFKGKWDDKTMLSVKEAFGSDEAVNFIELLMGKTGKLRADMASLNKVTGMDKARQMAGKMTDVWGRAGASFNVMAVTFSQKLLPSIEPVVDKLVGFIGYLVQCMDIAPELTGKIGLIVTAAILLGGVMGLLGMVVAINKMAFLGLKTVFGPLISLTKVLTFTNVKLAAAMLANPFTWVVLGIVALAVAVGGLILYWDEFKAAFGDTWWGSAIISMVQSVCQWWEALTSALSDGRWGDALMATLEAVLLPLKAVGNGISWIGEKLGLASGPKVDFMGQEVAAATVAPSSVSALEAPRTLSMAPGFATTQIAGAMTKNNGKNVSIGSVTFQTETPLNPDQLGEWGLSW